MIYYDTLNNAELFATYAFTQPAAWKKVIERVVTHSRYGNGTIKEKDGVIFQIQFSDELRFFCELDFFGSDFANVQFTNISLPSNLDRDDLIDTLHSWEVKRAGRFYRGPYKHYRRDVRQAEWLYQQNLVKQEYTKLQQKESEQKERVKIECAVSSTTGSRSHSQNGYTNGGYYGAEWNDMRNDK